MRFGEASQDAGVHSMNKSLVMVLLISSVCIRGGTLAWSQEVPYTLEDRDRLIRVEATLKELKDSVDRRFEQMDKRFTEFQGSMDKRFTEFQNSVDRRFEQMMTFMWILASVFGGLVVATIGVTVWDRRTALAPALRRSRELEEREERIERALRELAQHDPRVAEALKHAGLL
jgi:Flp pilus assembly protein TadB